MWGYIHYFLCYSPHMGSRPLGLTRNIDRSPSTDEYISTTMQMSFPPRGRKSSLSYVVFDIAAIGRACRMGPHLIVLHLGSGKL